MRKLIKLCGFVVYCLILGNTHGMQFVYGTDNNEVELLANRLWNFSVSDPYPVPTYPSAPVGTVPPYLQCYSQPNLPAYFSAPVGTVPPYPQCSPQQNPCACHPAAANTISSYPSFVLQANSSFPKFSQTNPKEDIIPLNHNEIPSKKEDLSIFNEIESEKELRRRAKTFLACAPNIPVITFNRCRITTKFLGWFTTQILQTKPEKFPKIRLENCDKDYEVDQIMANIEAIYKNELKDTQNGEIPHPEEIIEHAILKGEKVVSVKKKVQQQEQPHKIKRQSSEKPVSSVKSQTKTKPSAKGQLQKKVTPQNKQVQQAKRQQSQDSPTKTKKQQKHRK